MSATTRVTAAQRTRTEVSTEPHTLLPRASRRTRTGTGACLEPWQQSKCLGATLADPHEREANRIAEMVMQTPHESTATPLRVQHLENRQGEGGAEVRSIVHEVLRAPGLPLGDETRSFMEARLGHDFSRVRVHTDAKAADSARAAGARAYTVGNDIVFMAGQYAPHSLAGRGLVAHELTHVIQQRRGEFAQPHVVNGSGGPPLHIQRQAQAAAPLISSLIGPAVGGVAAIPGFIDVRGALSYASDQVTYPANLTRVPDGAREEVKRVASFESYGLFSNNRTDFVLRGSFWPHRDYPDLLGAIEESPYLANVYLDLSETTEYSHSSLDFRATALRTAYGTQLDPQIRFVCSGRFNPAGLGDCRYRVTLSVDRFARVRLVESHISAGAGRFRRDSEGFTLLV